jgi:membrane protein DedA with SNARE-associated domain
LAWLLRRFIDFTFHSIPWEVAVSPEGLGVPPLPEEAGILYAASLAALHPEVHWWMAWPAATLGIMAADFALYGIGRLWGRKILDSRWVARVVPQDRQRRIEDQFHRHGMKFLLTARLLPPVRTGVFLIAGMIHFSILRFLIADLIYGIVGVGLVFFGGTALVALLHQAGDWLLVAITIFVVGAALFYFYRYRRKPQQEGSR